MQSVFSSFNHFQVWSFILFSSFFILLARKVPRIFVLEKNVKQGTAAIPTILYLLAYNYF